ncbi:MAG: hypothetical protein AAFR70_14810, partial [Pseudomonadota bacterium]
LELLEGLAECTVRAERRDPRQQIIEQRLLALTEFARAPPPEGSDRTRFQVRVRFEVGSQAVLSRRHEP